MSKFRGRSPINTAPHILLVDVVWSTNHTGTAGVVLLYDTLVNEYKIYWGATSGDDEWRDICHISSYGNSAPIDRGGMWFDLESYGDNPFEIEENCNES